MVPPFATHFNPMAMLCSTWFTVLALCSVKGLIAGGALRGSGEGTGRVGAAVAGVSDAVGSTVGEGVGGADDVAGDAGAGACGVVGEAWACAEVPASADGDCRTATVGS